MARCADYALTIERNLVQTKLAQPAAGLPHEQWAEPPLGFVRVVCVAAQFEIVDGGRPALGEGNAVMVLEPGRLGATAFRPGEGASIVVASADRASDMRGNIA